MAPARPAASWLSGRRSPGVTPGLEQTVFLLIDNYDSFTWNLWHALHAVGVPCRVYRNDALSAQAFLELHPRALILSPGPATPDQAGNVPELLARAPSSLPILGVCLGHQAIAEAFGGTLEVQNPAVVWKGL